MSVKLTSEATLIRSLDHWSTVSSQRQRSLNRLRRSSIFRSPFTFVRVRYVLFHITLESEIGTFFYRISACILIWCESLDVFLLLLTTVFNRDIKSICWNRVPSSTRYPGTDLSVSILVSEIQQISVWGSVILLLFFLCRNGSLEHFQEIVFECFSCLEYRSVWSRFSRYVQLSFFVWSLSERFSRSVWKNLSVRDFCDPFCRPRFFLCVISSVVYYRSDIDQNSSFFCGEVSRSILQWISDHVSYYPDTIMCDVDSASLRDLTSFSDVLRFTLR